MDARPDPLQLWPADFFFLFFFASPFTFATSLAMFNVGYEASLLPWLPSSPVPSVRLFFRQFLSLHSHLFCHSPLLHKSSPFFFFYPCNTSTRLVFSFFSSFSKIRHTRFSLFLTGTEANDDHHHHPPPVLFPFFFFSHKSLTLLQCSCGLLRLCCVELFGYTLNYTT